MMRDGGYRRRAIWLGVLLGLSIPGATVPARGEDAAPRGRLVQVLNQDTWQSAQGLLPEEFLDRYKRGEWTHEIWEAPPDTHFGEPDFLAAGARNAGRFALGPEGGIIEIATGKQPPFIYGPPFPTIDPSDPQAGTKIVWNFFYQSYILTTSRNFVSVDWVGTRGLERRLATEVYQRFFDGVPEKYRPRDNPQNFLFQQFTTVAKPADLQGTVSLTHRFRDPTKRDQVWTYVPALRRVRAVSPVNRSDGFLGSDIAQDDGSYFDGKPEDFTWKLVGEGHILLLIDRTAVLEQKHQLKRLPEGGTEATDSLRPRFAYQMTDSAGHPWRPLAEQFILVKRAAWIVEGTPKDPYYLFGKLLLRFDKETWRGTYNSKYDWKGEILNSYLPTYGPYFPLGDEWHAYAWALFTMAQNWKMNRATVTYANPEKAYYQSRIAIPDNFFNVDALMRAGK
jgi:hypothetical protein